MYLEVFWKEVAMVCLEGPVLVSTCKKDGEF
jgi:hypothetical protein